jgi:glucose/mannose-6-phosphate isomerase
MSDVLDNPNVLNQRDPEGALGVAAQQYSQVAYDAKITEDAHDGRTITSVIVTGMGGSALAALIAKVWLKNDLTIPFEVVRGYDLPAYVNEQTLVVASSYSGNTEETLSALKQAKEKGAQIGIIASGGKLIEAANEHSIAHTHTGVLEVPSGLQPRMAMIYNLKALMLLLENFGIVTGKLTELTALEGWLQQESAQWGSDVPTSQNYAKQLAEEAVGKTPVFYGGALTAPLAYKWKISWNETSKNVAFWNEYPEFNHNEFMGWTSHPIEKPFAIFDLVSSLEHPQILKRFEISDRLLSGKRPKATTIQLKGDSVIGQLLWGAILADFASIYAAILNGVDPTPVDLIEKLKTEL